MEIGDTLYCKDRSTVTVCDFDDENLTVEYKGKRYHRPISVINDTLFLQPVNNSFFGRIKQMVNTDEYDSLGFDRNGYDKDGYNHNGFNFSGYDREGYDHSGYDKAGFDRSGFNKSGYNQAGFDKFGYNISGRDKYGYDRQGYDEKGYDRNGFDLTGIDKEGYDRQGFNREGYGKNGFNKLGLDKAGFNCDGYGDEGYNRRGYNKAGYDRNGFNANGHDKDGYDGNGFNKQGRDRSGHDKNGYDISGYNAEGFSRAGYDHEGYNCEGFNKDGYGRDGFNRKGVNRTGDLRPEMSREYRANETKLYHETYGRGTFLRFSSNTSSIYIHVMFDNEKDERMFPYPDSIGRYLFLQKTEKTLEKENLLGTDYGKKEYEKEKSFFDDLVKEIAVPYRTASRELQDAHVTRYDLAEPDEWDETTYKAVGANKIRANEKARLFTQLYSEPYFAKVDYAKKNNMYIGKHGYKDIITEWTDPVCSIYYEYQMYIGDKQHNLSLIRDFDIYNSKFYGFLDTYNRQNGKSTAGASTEYSDIIKDERLLKIINAQRKDKEVHDIIATIQANQYKMITHPKDNAMVIEGCAGSGKTMILLHRLRYLLRNDKNLQATNVYVLSPTDTLNIESGELASTLQLDNVKRFSNQSLFKHVGSTYAKNEKLYWPMTTKKGIASNSTIRSDAIKKLYDRETLEDAVADIRKLYQWSWGQKDFNKLERAYILTEKASIAGIQGSLTSAQLKQLSKGKKLYEKALIECGGRSPKNAKAAINDVKSDFSRRQDAIRDDKNFITGYVDVEKKIKLTTAQKEFKTGVLMFLIDHPNHMGEQTLYLDKNSNPKMVNDSSGAFKNTFDLFEKISILKTYGINVGDDPFAFFRKYSTVCDKESRFNSFCSNSSNYNYLYDVIEHVIRDEKQTLGISVDACYEWEGFWKAYIFSALFNSPFSNVELIFVDEFQDYSISELEFLARAFPACCFNFFGDFKQSISLKGISESNFSKQIRGKKVDRFFISENYRNAMEITQYVNTQFGMDMRPVGISGKVNSISLRDITSIEISKDDRAAFIVSDINQIKDNELLNAANVIRTVDGAIERGILNIMPVAMAKGLEFETVVVKTDNMTENEKYVAMTRALNSLFIVESK